ncbi:MAG: DUF3298 domain-containing protein [Pyrinomonadaceae bacterium]|nr:DUF3298 domain-containing protein [Pyrinomonadaceae bacterium]
MNRLSPLAIFTLLIAFVGLTACSKATPTDQAAANSNAGLQSQQADGGVTPQGQTKFFKGSIGSTLGLQMKLVREGDRLTGSYFYQKVGTRIDLRGTINKDGNLTLEEFDSSGKQTGVFQGNWKTDETGLDAIAGNWKGPNSNKQTAFSLHEEPIEFSSGVEVVARRISENNKKLKYEIVAEYPQLTGSGSANYEKFNQTIRGLVTKKVAGFKTEMTPDAEDPPLEVPEESSGSDLNIGYTIQLAKDDLISVMLDVGSYSAGAAHPNSYSEVANFDLKNGKLLKLSDLFQPRSKHLQIISAYCIADLKKQGKQKGEDSMLDDDWIQRGAGPDAENYSSWTIGKKGLGIVFDSYQVAAYAAGPQHVFVPYSVLKDIIKPDGPLAQFVK